MNTNIKKFIPAALMASVLLLNTSCKDSFLEVEPPTKATVEEYFSTEEHLGEALDACYVAAHMYDYNVYGGYGPLNFSDILGDDFLTGAGGPGDQAKWHLAGSYMLTPESTETCLHGYWAVSYDGVKAANEAIYYAELNKEKLSQEFVNRLKAEAGVLRAYYYTVVWKWYGNIPYFNAPLAPEDKVEQLDHDAAYEAIITDLEAAIALNALPMYSDEANLGRATKAMAYMVYAELVMYQNDEARFAQALKYMNEVIAESHYKLNPDFAAIWTPDGEWCDESIWEINYTDGPLCVRGYEGAEFQIGGTWLPQVSGPENCEFDDPDVMNGSWGTYIPRRTAKESYEAGDLRIDPTFFEANTDGSSRYQQQGLFNNKYIPRKSHIAEGTGGADHCRYNDNFRVYRFAETLLNAAELELRVNNNAAKAADLVSQVRQRAGLAAVTTVTLDDIMTERRHEFCGEGKRYWDLVRMEDVAGVSQKATAVLVVDAQPVNAKGDPGRSQAWTPNKKYTPILAAEISASQGALKQNSDYLK